jgi:hypothetical protein
VISGDEKGKARFRSRCVRSPLGARERERAQSHIAHLPQPKQSTTRGHCHRVRRDASSMYVPRTNTRPKKREISLLLSCAFACALGCPRVGRLAGGGRLNLVQILAIRASRGCPNLGPTRIPPHLAPHNHDSLHLSLRWLRLSGPRLASRKALTGGCGRAGEGPSLVQGESLAFRPPARPQRSMEAANGIVAGEVNGLGPEAADLPFPPSGGPPHRID